MAKHKSQPESVSQKTAKPINNASLSFFVYFSLRLIGLLFSPFKGPAKVVALPLLVGLCVWLVGGVVTYGSQAITHETELQSRNEQRAKLQSENEAWNALAQAHPTAREVVIGQLNLAYQLGNSIELERDQEDLLKIDPNSATVAAVLSKIQK